MTSKITRRSLLSGVAAASVLSTDALARPVFLRAGRGSGSGSAPPAPAGELTTFILTNTSATASSLGYKRIGLPFPYQAVPSGNRLRIERSDADVPAQFDGYSYYPDGSLRFCTAFIRDTSFAASETRTYSIVQETAAWNRASVATLSNITGASNFRVVLTSITGFTSGAIPDHTATFNTHAATPTRVTKYAQGPTSDSWNVWGMFRSNTTNTEHAHLKVDWYVTFVKNSSGAQAGIEITPIIELNWWDDRGVTNGKENFTYVAGLYNGSVLIQDYGTVDQPYGMHWALIRMQNDDQHATPHWVGATRPTLHYKPNRQYWISTGMVPPIDLSRTYALPGLTNFQTYIPGHKFAHEADIGGTGDYLGKGVLTLPDGIAFVQQTPLDTRLARVNSFAGLHIPNHARVTDLRQRPATAIQSADATSDIANTIAPSIFWDERSSSTPLNYYDFRSSGMPAPRNAYHSGGNDSSQGFDPVVGGTTSGTTVWTSVWDVSHSVSYSYFTALYEGEQYMIRDCIDRASQPIHGLGTYKGIQPTSAWYDPEWIQEYPPNGIAYPGTTTTIWSGVFTRMDNPQASRALAWATFLLNKGQILCAADDPQAAWLNRANEVNAKFIATDFNLIPSNIKGVRFFREHQISVWMDAFEGFAYYTAYETTRDTNWLVPAHHIAYIPASFVDANMVGLANIYWAMARPTHLSVWYPTTNQFFPNGKLFQITEFCSIDATTDVVTMPLFYGIAWTLGDEVIAAQYPNRTIVPSELSLGTVYYAVPQGGTNVKLSTTSDGLNIVNFTNSYPSLSLASRPQKTDNPIYHYQFWNANDRGMIMLSLYALAYRNGYSGANQTGMDKYHNYFRVNTNTATHPIWNLVHPPSP